MSETFSEGFEGTGYESGSPTETVGSGSTVNEDKATSAVSGAPSTWQGQCLETISTGDVAYVLLDGSTEDPSYTRIEFIIGSDGLASEADYSLVATGADSSLNQLWDIILYQTGGVKYIILQAKKDDGGGAGDIVSAFSYDTRYRAEFKWDNAANEWEYKFDGTSINSGSITGAPASRSLYYVICGQHGVGSEALTAYYDSISINDSVFPGPVLQEPKEINTRRARRRFKASRSMTRGVD